MFGFHEFSGQDVEWHKIDEDTWQRKDEWGNIWQRVDPTSQGEITEGALKNIDDVEFIPLPDFWTRLYISKLPMQKTSTAAAIQVLIMVD